MTPNPPTHQSRVEWLDLFRGLAVLTMIETHVVNTFLRPEFRELFWFPWLNWCNGLIAPAFLFIAGYVQGMSWKAEPMTWPSTFRKIRRLLGIALLGYALHIPFVELGKHDWAGAFRAGTVVDVLPCLAVTLLAVLAIQSATSLLAEQWRRSATIVSITILSVETIWLAPYSPQWQTGLLPLDAYLNTHTGSLFPLFPWAAFVLIGALAGMFASRNIAWLLLAAAGVRCVAVAIQQDTFSVLSPHFFCERLAWLLVMTVLVYQLARIWRPKPVLFAGRESLIMYAAHLIIIGRLLVAGLPQGGFDWPGTMLMFSLVLALTVVAAFLNAQRKRRQAASS